MRRVAETRPVLLVNSIGMRMPRPGRNTQTVRRIARKAASVAHLLRQPLPDVPDFHVMTPFIVPFYGSPRARAVNASLVRHQVQLVLKHLGMVDPVCFLTVPTAWSVVERMAVSQIVFNRSDKHSAFREVDESYIGDLEAKLLARADHVVYTSRSLLEHEQGATGDRAFFLDHGVDLEHFTPMDADVVDAGREPPELQAIPHPRIGFFGGFDDYVVDFALIERVARALPDAHVVLIGAATCSMRELEALPNVHWLGFRPYESIPALAHGFDVAIMPWLRNEWITHCNPIKLKEYLALGLPVVSTDFPELHRYRHVVRIARSSDEFVALVRATLADGGVSAPAARRAAVIGEGWNRRVEELIDLTEQDDLSQHLTTQGAR
jgi:glycosyltransferase involved in cell wall biosynthesis